MNHKIKKASPWREPDPVLANAVLVAVNRLQMPISYREALYMSDGDNGEPAVVVSRKTLIAIPISNLEVLVAGLCGHYNCGGLLTVSLN